MGVHHMPSLHISQHQLTIVVKKAVRLMARASGLYSLRIILPSPLSATRPIARAMATWLKSRFAISTI